MSERRPYLLRLALDDERDRIAGLTRHAYSQYAMVMAPAAWAGLSNAIERALRANVPVERIVADDGGRIIGSAMLYPARADAYGDSGSALAWPEVRLVSVAPAARGRGVARALMTECIRRAREAGATAIGVHTSASMHAARQLYESMGFRRVPEHDFHPPGAEAVEGYMLPLV